MVWDAESGVVGDPSKVRDVDHRGTYFKVRGPLNTPPAPQGRPVMLQAGGSPRGIRACAYVADMAFGGDRALDLQIQQRQELDRALVALGRDPASMGIMWQQPVVIAETAQEAIRRRDLLLTAIPLEGAGVYLSHNGGYDFSTLPEHFTLGELQADIVASQASPAGFVRDLAHQLGADVTLSRNEFFEHGMRIAMSYDTTLAGTAAQVADRLEEVFEATGGRGGFMLGHTVADPLDLVRIVDLLVPELQRRGRFRREYRGTTLRENLLEE
jgi:alkanesulfonate monooxygenase SsuD/methylene tetrahydromethanopterin reductase-like flavin-dependent oxidoreductase (luciferase family)